jgi:hypothetical protein
MTVGLIGSSSLFAGSGKHKEASDKSADMSKPVQVFILLGQSNMVGFGSIKAGKKGPTGSLEHAVKNEKLYPFLVDKSGNWIARKDVRNVRSMGSGSSIGKILINDWMDVEKLASNKKTARIGPEVGIGFKLGDALEAPVMVLKSCIGNRSIGWDLLAPGTPRYKHDGKEQPGYKEMFKSKKDRTIVKFKEGMKGWYAGCQYDGDINSAKKVLEDIGKYYPGAKKYEVAGFFFWQGDKDRRNAAHAANYEKNLVLFIKALRKDFNSPNAKFVLATLGQTSKEKKSGNDGLVFDAQMAVDGSTGKYPEFKGNVASVYAHPLSKGGSSGGHYSGDARTYTNVGVAMGEAMAKLLKK